MTGSQLNAINKRKTGKKKLVGFRITDANTVERNKLAAGYPNGEMS